MHAKKQTIRAFIAIKLPAEVTAVLGQLGQQLATQLPAGGVRWVKPQQIHLTLRFLGNTPVEQLPAIAGAMDQLARQHASFVLQLDRLGCFPHRRRPRVIWMGLDGETEALRSLKDSLDLALRPFGWPAEERPFKAHLTLGRVKDNRNWTDVDWGVAVEKAVIPVTAVYLIESKLRPDGPVYTVQHTSYLAD